MGTPGCFGKKERSLDNMPRRTTIFMAAAAALMLGVARCDDDDPLCSTCDTNAYCKGDACLCNDGYVGDGQSCTPKGTTKRQTQAGQSTSRALNMTGPFPPPPLMPNEGASSSSSSSVVIPPLSKEQQDQLFGTASSSKSTSSGSASHSALSTSVSAPAPSKSGAAAAPKNLTLPQIRDVTKFGEENEDEDGENDTDQGRFVPAQTLSAPLPKVATKLPPTSAVSISSSADDDTDESNVQSDAAAEESRSHTGSDSSTKEGSGEAPSDQSDSDSDSQFSVEDVMAKVKSARSKLIASEAQLRKRREQAKLDKSRLSRDLQGAKADLEVQTRKERREASKEGNVARQLAKVNAQRDALLLQLRKEKAAVEKVKAAEEKDTKIIQKDTKSVQADEKLAKKIVADLKQIHSLAGWRQIVAERNKGRDEGEATPATEEVTNQNNDFHSPKSHTNDDVTRPSYDREGMPGERNPLVQALSIPPVAAKVTSLDATAMPQGPSGNGLALNVGSLEHVLGDQAQGQDQPASSVPPLSQPTLPSLPNSPAPPAPTLGGNTAGWGPTPTLDAMSGTQKRFSATLGKEWAQASAGPKSTY